MAGREDVTVVPRKPYLWLCRQLNRDSEWMQPQPDGSCTLLEEAPLVYRASSGSGTVAGLDISVYTVQGQWRCSESHAEDATPPCSLCKVLDLKAVLGTPCLLFPLNRGTGILMRLFQDSS